MEGFTRRECSSNKEIEQPNKRSKLVCSYGEKCYRRNPDHFKDVEHPHLEEMLKQDKEKIIIPEMLKNQKSVILEQLEILRKIKNTSPLKEINKSSKEDIPSTSSQNDVNVNKITISDLASFFNSSENPLKSINCTTTSNSSSNYTNSSSRFIVKNGKLNMKQKLERAAPYNIFFTTISDCPDTWSQENSITIRDLLCPSLGELKTSLQINFMIDIIWLMEQYEARGVGKKPLTAFFGYEFPGMKEYMSKKLRNVTPYFVPMKDPFGTHHSKMGIYVYTDGSLRVVVSTANLYYEDWNVYAQGLWISPACPKLPDSAPDTDGGGSTGFKNNLLTYLQSYNTPIAKEWIDYVRRADFNAVKVFLVSSIPGKHFQNQNTGCHHQRVGDLLSRHCDLPDKGKDNEGPLSWPIIAQSSSIGNLGKTPAEWFRSVLLRALATYKKHPFPANSNAIFNVVFPSRSNVLSSYKGEDGGGCLPYGKNAHEKQKWFTSYLHQWKADGTNRTRSMPHIKTYCRVSPCTTKLAYFLITSANISKAAWGNNPTKKEASTYVRSYEVGVMFLPKFFDEEYFHIKSTDGDSKKLFPFIFDLPLTPYGPRDEPWTQC